MKKILAALLCLALALSCAFALAENEGTDQKALMGRLSMNGEFELRCELPEGYRLETLDYDLDHCISALVSDDPMKARMTISIAFDELLSEVDRLNDLDDDALARIAATFQEEDGVEISYMETAYGTKLMVVRENVELVDYVDIYTIYKGYEVEFVLTVGEGALEQGLTEEQIQLAVKFLSDLDFVSAQ